MAEFTIGANAYRAGTIPALKQFHIARRLAPVVGSISPLLRSGVVLDELLQPVAAAIAGLSDVDCNYILNGCLGVVQRQSGQTWSNIWNAGAGDLQFQDITMPEMLQIAGRVIVDQLGPIFAGLGSTSLTGAGQTSN